MDSGQYEALRQQICEIGRRLYDRGYISGAEGNISVRLADGTFLCTPTSVSKGFLTPDQVARIDAKGQLLAGPLQPSSEFRMHLAIYEVQPQAKAIVHAHPPYATALGVASIPLPLNMTQESMVYLGQVPLLPYETPGTTRLADAVADACRICRVVMMKNHGATAWAAAPDHAWMLMEALEACSRIAYLARTLGHMDLLSAEKMAELAKPCGRKQA